MFVLDWWKIIWVRILLDVVGYDIFSFFNTDLSTVYMRVTQNIATKWISNIIITRPFQFVLPKQPIFSFLVQFHKIQTHEIWSKLCFFPVSLNVRPVHILERILTRAKDAHCGYQSKIKGTPRSLRVLTLRM